MNQTIELSDLAATVDASTQKLFARAYVGAAGEVSGGARVTVQPLDSAGTATGAAATFGPPTAADRLDRSLVVPCGAVISVPPGTRAARVTVEASGPASTAMADNVIVASSSSDAGGVGIPLADGLDFLLFGGRGQEPTCAQAVLQPPIGGGGPDPRADAPVPHPRVTSVTLQRRRLRMSISQAAAVKVTIRRGDRTQHAQFTAREKQRVTRRLRRPLVPGAYRLTISMKPSIGTKTVVSHVRRRV